MSQRFFDRDPYTGAVETFEYDEDTDKVIIHRQEDVTTSLENNKRAQTDGTDGYNEDRDMVLQASIPINVIYEWATRHGVRAWDKNHLPGVIRLLNSNEYCHLRRNKLVI